MLKKLAFHVTRSFSARFTPDPVPWNTKQLAANFESLHNSELQAIIKGYNHILPTIHMNKEIVDASLELPDPLLIQIFDDDLGYVDRLVKAIVDTRDFYAGRLYVS